MKLPIGVVARFLLKRVVLPAIGKAVVSSDNSLTTATAKRALEDAVQDEVLRQVAKAAR